jgi:hypothetical protein
VFGVVYELGRAPVVACGKLLAIERRYVALKRDRPLVGRGAAPFAIRLGDEAGLCAPVHVALQLGV